MPTWLVIVIGWLAIAGGIGFMIALLTAKRHERDELLARRYEELYGKLRRDVQAGRRATYVFPGPDEPPERLE